MAERRGLAQASPNIALIKYWGKQTSSSDQDRNVGLNASLSMTLSQTRTQSRLSLLRQGGAQMRLNGKAASSADLQKVQDHLTRVALDWGEPPPQHFCLESDNNFPAGTGLASSASGFAALTLAAVDALLGRAEAQRLLRHEPQRLSALARRGSGSAARSVEGPFVKWEGTQARRLLLDWKLKDTLLIFSREEKKISSTQGHEAARSSPLLKPRLQRLPLRLQALEAALAAHDLAALGPLIEEEALEMHEVARAGDPPADYLLPQTTIFLESLPSRRDFYFTIDAGPNLHFISERPVAHELKSLAQHLGLAVEVLEDEAGPGASFLDS